MLRVLIRIASTSIKIYFVGAQYNCIDPSRQGVYNDQPHHMFYHQIMENFKKAILNLDHHQIYAQSVLVCRCTNVKAVHK